MWELFKAIVDLAYSTLKLITAIMFSYWYFTHLDKVMLIWTWMWAK